MNANWRALDDARDERCEQGTWKVVGLAMVRKDQTGTLCVPVACSRLDDSRSQAVGTAILAALRDHSVFLHGEAILAVVVCCMIAILSCGGAVSARQFFAERDSSTAQSSDGWHTARSSDLVFAARRGAKMGGEDG